ncbi:hypothetical protein BVX97_04775 [bacterium E08(2017)]|nr:hypothetical protein BVX97_04775 [bacterium E08(2017)]
MLESLAAVALICVIFFGALQIAQMYLGREILYHSAARGARAKTVGFNWWMVRKAIYVAAIPNSGNMITPELDDTDETLTALMNSEGADGSMTPWVRLMRGEVQPSNERYQAEQARIPEFMGAGNEARARAVLNYHGWENNAIQYDAGESAALAMIDAGETVIPSSTIEVSVWQSYTNWLPLRKVFYTGDEVRMSGISTLENHYPVYLNESYY